mmetsp:Transcript_15152/g.42439  ORF Transcript_15152/g.42439 Transcript_15152/m.42439 type:complete len:217 (+) Transcript_15152:265-915(+)
MTQPSSEEGACSKPSGFRSSVPALWSPLTSEKVPSSTKISSPSGCGWLRKELPGPYLTTEVTRPLSLPPVWNTLLRQTLGIGLAAHSISPVCTDTSCPRSGLVPLAMVQSEGRLLRVCFTGMDELSLLVAAAGRVDSLGLHTAAMWTKRIAVSIWCAQVRTAGNKALQSRWGHAEVPSERGGEWGGEGLGVEGAVSEAGLAPSQKLVVVGVSLSTC